MDKLFAQVRQRYPSDAALRDALRHDGITEDELRAHLQWQATALQFTQARFAPVGGSNTTMDQAMDAWLKQARSTARIRLFPEAFQ